MSHQRIAVTDGITNTTQWATVDEFNELESCTDHRQLGLQAWRWLHSIDWHVLWSEFYCLSDACRIHHCLLCSYNSWTDHHSLKQSTGSPMGLPVAECMYLLSGFLVLYSHVRGRTNVSELTCLSSSFWNCIWDTCSQGKRRQSLGQLRSARFHCPGYCTTWTWMVDFGYPKPWNVQTCSAGLHCYSYLLSKSTVGPVRQLLIHSETSHSLFYHATKIKN